MEEFSLGPINLIVGKNASGKSRTLNVIVGCANLVSGDRKTGFHTGDWHVQFEHDRERIDYSLRYEGGKVTQEEFGRAGKGLMHRGPGGGGTIHAEREGKDMEFQVPDDQLACVARRDSVQHPFFEPLYQWGQSLRHYRFGTQMGKDVLVVPVKGEPPEQPNVKDANVVITTFQEGVRHYRQPFLDSIVEDMRALGYEIDEVGVGPVENVVMSGGSPPPRPLREGTRP